ncbi:hypothetical protein ACIQNT_04060 [Streptomyces luteogriseus]|uniref:Uncharacterized protein n=1 Tax=Streptomyces luteogriseus TaxID=68233 RepID=A0A7W7DHW1_9ACTN|nr:hypothetical protein [Streptomyces luteogriseus]MBB4710992.1 hypothetical protein [Streptomyces luteogriseus]
MGVGDVLDHAMCREGTGFRAPRTAHRRVRRHPPGAAAGRGRTGRGAVDPPQG